MSTRWIAEFAIGMFGAPRMAEVITGEGWATRAELDAMFAALRDWSERPDAFMSWIYCAAIGWADRRPAADAP